MRGVGVWLLIQARNGANVRESRAHDIARRRRGNFSAANRCINILSITMLREVLTVLVEATKGPWEMGQDHTLLGRPIRCFSETLPLSSIVDKYGRRWSARARLSAASAPPPMAEKVPAAASIDTAKISVSEVLQPALTSCSSYS
ncbi:hypothetical protein LIA77_07451 [Sarocladium implicatum]|nr:hypothetical protein LIA77_07451 [Sarocladium implicatum]